MKHFCAIEIGVFFSFTATKIDEVVYGIIVSLAGFKQSN